MPFHDILTQPLAFQSLHPSARLPAYATSGAAALDISTVEGRTVASGKAATFATGLAAAVPDGFVLALFSRSGHGFKHGLRLANAVGIIDSDYRGEIQVRLRNDGPVPVAISPGDRIAQAILLPIPRVLPSWVPLLQPTARGDGGFGSTGA